MLSNMARTSLSDRRRLVVMMSCGGSSWIPPALLAVDLSIGSVLLVMMKSKPIVVQSLVVQWLVSIGLVPSLSFVGLVLGVKGEVSLLSVSGRSEVL